MTIDGDRARLIAHMRAEHWLEVASGPSPRYTMLGFYDDKLVRTSDGWNIAEMQLNVTRTEGPRFVMEEAQRRARDKRAAASKR